jgi:hypothetical protein
MFWLKKKQRIQECSNSAGLNLKDLEILYGLSSAIVATAFRISLKKLQKNV